MVAADRKLEALGEVSYAGLVPSDTRDAYDEIINKISPWDSQANSDARRNDAKAAYLAQVIRRFPGVANADVIIDPTHDRVIGSGGRQPTATVQITTRDGVTPDKNLIRSAAATVAGAQSGMKMSHVTVVADGVTHHAPDSDDEAGGAFGGAEDVLTAQQQAERAVAEKITNYLSFINGVLVTVSVDMNIETKTRSDETYDPKNVAQKEVSTENESTEENSTQAAAAAEPGAVPNSGLSVGGNNNVTAPGGPGSGTSSTKTRESTKFENHFSKSNTQVVTPAGKVSVLAAAVRVPRSYFAGIYKMNNPSAQKEPDDAALEPLLTAELPKIRNEVKKCTHIASDDDISVEPYTDVMPAALLAASQTTSVAARGGGNAVTAMLSDHYKEIGVGVLALMSLFMVSGMVKKSAAAPAVAAPPIELGEAPALAAAEEIAGEMDADALKSQQMVEQVSAMVKDDPDAAANLVKRWLNKS
jgi:flagellar biosynthesis/type III secretory pathway M-ring protein FliF/YscJ